MDLNDKFLNFPTMDISLIVDSENTSDINLLIHKMITKSNEAFLSDNLQSSQLQSCYSVLCFYYKRTIKLIPFLTSKQLSDLRICDILNLNDEKFASTEPSFKDILILQTVIFLQGEILNIFKNIPLDNSRFDQTYKLDVLVSSVRLINYLNPDAYSVKDSEQISNIITKCLQEVIKNLSYYNFLKIAKLIYLFVETFGKKNIGNICSTIAQYCDKEEVFNLLCFLTGNCLPELNFSDDKKPVQVIYDEFLQCNFYDSKFWRYYLKNLNDPVPAKRKQINFMITNTLKIEAIVNSRNFVDNKDGLVPFVCKKNSPEQSSVFELKTLFLLTLDALEETQKQFALQAVQNLDKLIQHHHEHKVCGNCFGSVWVLAIFKKILTHDNRTVVYEGLIQALKLDLNFFTSEFLSVICKSLNDVRLYKKDNFGSDVKSELVAYLQKIEQKDSDIIKKLLLEISIQLWNPVCIFHIFNAMNEISKVTNFWNNDTLKILYDITEKNQGRPMTILHRYLFRKILKVIMKFYKDKDLLVLSSLLKLLLENEPRQDIWQEVCNWLAEDQTLIEKMLNIIEDLFKNKFPSSQFLTKNCSYIECLEFCLALLSKSRIIFENKNCAVRISIEANLLYNLKNISSRPYCDMHFVTEIIKFVYLIIKRSYAQNWSHYTTITFYLRTLWDEIIKLILSKLRNSADINYMQSVTLTKIVELLGHDERNLEHLKAIKTNCIKMLEKEVYKEQSITYPFTIGLLCTYTKAIIQNQKLFKSKFSMNDIELMNWILKIYSSKPVLDPEDPIKDIIVSDFYANIVQIMANIFDYTTIEKKDLPLISREIPTLLQCATKKHIPLTLNFVLKCTQCMEANNDLLVNGELLKLCWKAALDCKKSAAFNPAVNYTVAIMVNISRLSNTPEQLKLLEEVTDEMLEEGELIAHIKLSFLLYGINFKQDNLRYKILISCLLHGDVLRQHQIIEIETCDSILETRDVKFFGENSSVAKTFRSLCDLNFNLAGIIRFFAVINFMEKTTDKDYVLKKLLEKLAGFNNKRYFNDSLIHKLSTRILQLILFSMEFWIKNSDLAENILSTLITAFLNGNHQLSVRMIIEWIFSIACLKMDNYRTKKLWNIMQTVEKERPNSMHSLFRIIHNVFRVLKADEQLAFSDIALPEISLYCMDQKFTTRLYSQFVFKHVYETLQETGNAKKELSYLYKTIEKNLTIGNIAVAYKSLEKEFYLTKFHPIEHLTFECIYHDIPRLTNVCTTESLNRLIVRTFKEFGNFRETENLEYVELLINTKESIAADHSDISTDAQKKITPWKNVNREFILSYNNQEQISVSNLIVVASLVERAPNLGGIVRTCEIFGAKELVISNIQYLNNKEFLNLSVSAEKWLNISEVKPYQLVNYIVEKKAEDYVVIGAEQTVKSINLKDMKWKKNTILVLGHEKNGIPADIIPILDQCVEIPQIGITRSLNVHVSGALCIWQYTLQNVLQ